MTERDSDGRVAILELLDSRPVACYPALAAIGGGVTSGVFLAQLLSWHDKGQDPDDCIYKTQTEWQARTGLTHRERRTTPRRLRRRGSLEKKRAGIAARLLPPRRRARDRAVGRAGDRG